jgi:hypothetical protein
MSFLSILSQLQRVHRREQGEGDSRKHDFQFFPSCSRACAYYSDIIVLDWSAEYFQFFPSCSLGIYETTIDATMVREISRLSILSQLQQHENYELAPHLLLVLSILSQLQPQSTSFRSWCCRRCKRIFQFFPSCSYILSILEEERTLSRFQFFPSCSARGTRPRPCARAAYFQFFPSCSRDSGSLPPYKPFFSELRSS